jgi:hypothetical protein
LEEATSVGIPIKTQPFLGAAYLCRHKGENAHYIAKKILLGSLNQKEQEGALLEV